MARVPDHRPLLVGVIHLRPLPGAPRWGGDIDAVARAAAADARAYAAGGADAVVIENFGDLPFAPRRVPPETVAAMAWATRAVRESCDLPFGFNVLRNDAGAALALAAVTGGAFVRVNVHCGAAVTDQGIIQGDAFGTLRKRGHLCPNVQIWADVHVKHASPLGATPLADAAQDTWHRGLADALIVSGSGTGKPTDPSDLATVRDACPEARLFVGSGAHAGSARELVTLADGIIAGSSLKEDGLVHNPVDPARVEALRRAMG